MVILMTKHRNDNTEQIYYICVCVVFVCVYVYFVKCKTYLVKEPVFVSKFKISVLFLMWHQNMPQGLATREKHYKGVMKVFLINS